MDLLSGLKIEREEERSELKRRLKITAFFFLPLVTGFLVKQNPKNYLSNPFHLIDT